MLNRDEIKNYLDSKDIEYTESNGEFILTECIFCNDVNEHLYMSSITGLFHCKKCGSKGHFEQFKLHLGDIPDIRKAVPSQSEVTKIEMFKVVSQYSSLSKSDIGKKFLADRGITEESIDRFKLGYDNGNICIPHFVQGKPVNVKFRGIVVKEYKRVPGCPSVLFNTDNLDYSKDYVIITEGEFDTIKGVQEGIENMIASTVGADTFSFEWLPKLEPFKKIYLCYDNDEAGQRGAKKAAQKIGLERCYNIVLPKKDLNEFLLEYPVSDFKQYFDEARKFELEDITGIEFFIDKIDSYMSEGVSGLLTGYIQLDDTLKGLKNEDLIIISGASTVGKTTFGLNIINSFLKKGKSVLCFMLEGRIMFFLEKLISIETGQLPAFLPKERLEEIKNQLKGYKLYFYTGSQSMLNAKIVAEKTNLCKKMFDIDTVFLDHLHKIVERGSDNYSQLVGKTVSDLKNLAVDSKIPVIVVTHIRKIAKSSMIPTMMDLRDSSFIHQDADVILMLWSDRENELMKDNVVIKILKNKTGADQVDLFYTFDRTSGIFTEIKDETI